MRLAAAFRCFSTPRISCRFDTKSSCFADDAKDFGKFDDGEKDENDDDEEDEDEYEDDNNEEYAIYLQ